MHLSIQGINMIVLKEAVYENERNDAENDEKVNVSFIISGKHVHRLL